MQIMRKIQENGRGYSLDTGKCNFSSTSCFWFIETFFNNIIKIYSIVGITIIT